MLRSRSTVLLAIAAVTVLSVSAVALASGRLGHTHAKRASAHSSVRVYRAVPLRLGIRSRFHKPSPHESRSSPTAPADKAPPETTIVSAPPARTNATSASFGFSANEGGASFECKLDSGSWASCASPRAYSSLRRGTHQFSVRAKDAEGNVDPSPATSSWTIEAAAARSTAPPETTIVSAPPETTTATAASFSFESSVSGTFECKLDSGGWSGCASPQSYSSLDPGAHQFSVRAKDTSGNVDASPASFSWTVEAEPVTPPASEPPVTEPPASEPPSGVEILAPCTSTVSSVGAAQSAVSSAANGSVICVANGSYGKVALNAKKSGAGVTLRAANPGGATIAGATMAGSYITLARFVSTDSIQVEPGATGMTIEHNRVTGGGEGLDIGPTDTTSINDTKVIGNQLIGPFGEDAIHLNRYHDSNGDGIGILIEGNEITGVRENGNHSDCLQTVWVGDHIVYRRNYVHDNRCQGFFVKDQDGLCSSGSEGVCGPVEGITVEDNLFLRDKEPCASSDPGCGQPMIFQVFGPYTGFKMSRNTIWGDGADSIAAFREGTGSDTQISNNVIYRLWTDTNMTPATLSNNTLCMRETGSGGSWPAAKAGETMSCSLSFRNTAADDYRLGGERGVDWAPAEQHYGP